MATITLQLFIIFIFHIIENKKGKYLNIDNKKLLKVNHRILKIFVIFSILLSFQSSIIIIAFLITYVIYILKEKIKSDYKKIFNPKLIFKTYISIFKLSKINKSIKIIFCIILSYYLFTYILKFSLLILYLDKEPGSWALGLNNIYQLPNIIEHPFLFIQKIIFNTKSIIGQSLYPFRNYQKEASTLISLFLIPCFLRIRIKNIFGNYILIFSALILFITIFLSTTSNFIYAPTRHTIFIYPIFWIPLILLLDRLFLSKKWSIYRNIFLILVFIYFSFGSFHSIKQINYSELENQKLITFLKQSKFYLSNSYEQSSDITLHGSEEFRLTSQKKSNIEEIKKLEKYRIFMFSHREPFSNKENQIEYIFNNPLNKNCFPKSFQYSVVNKYEIFNKQGIEQNNFIINGGSNLFGYILEVKNNNSD